MWTCNAGLRSIRTILYPMMQVAEVSRPMVGQPCLEAGVTANAGLLHALAPTIAHARQAKRTHQSVPHLQPSVRLAKEVGAGLGQGEVLLQRLPPRT